MKKSVLWLTVSTVMALSLVIAACAPAATPPTTTPPTTPTNTTSPTTSPVTSVPTQAAPVTPVSDKPQYGGTLTMGLTADVTTFAGIENC